MNIKMTLEDFKKEFKIFCTDSQNPDSKKPGSYARAIEYLCVFLKKEYVDSETISLIKDKEDDIKNKQSDFYSQLRSFLKNRSQRDGKTQESYLENGFIRAAIPYLFEYWKTKMISENDDDIKDYSDRNGNAEILPCQKIFFGAPGTGKSHKIDYNLFKDEDGKPIGKGIKEIPEDRKFRTTFHPDYDYAQFVGAYKPKKELNETTNKEEITYSFVPQVFAKAYAAAWKLYFSAGNSSTSENQVYLIIEEINRGNCAQIFGDIFQLLDRNGEGFSQYSIDADCDFADWLGKYSDLSPESIWSEYKKKENVGAGKLKLPPNLNILATMNTSDQSLFPMDSAFKRRFDWEYVQIKYKKDEECGENWNADTFKIAVGDSKYMWLDFLEKVNADIYEATRSEDKQMGEFFIKPKDGKKILFEDFRSKVLFYLWDSVYKDETERQTVFHFAYENGDDKIKSVTFQSLFGKDAEAIVNKIMENLKVEKVTA